MAESEYMNLNNLLNPGNSEPTGNEIPLHELTLDSISYDWVQHTSKPSHLKKALRLIDDDGMMTPKNRKLFPRSPSSC